MQVKGFISWFKPEEVVRDKEGQVILDKYGDVLKKRKLGVNADYELNDGTIVKERFVCETSRIFSDEELTRWSDKNVMRLITLHFDDKESQAGHHFQNCYLTSVQPIILKEGDEERDFSLQ